MEYHRLNYHEGKQMLELDGGTHDYNLKAGRYRCEIGIIYMSGGQLISHISLQQFRRIYSKI